MFCVKRKTNRYLGPRLPAFAAGLGGTRGVTFFVVWPKGVALGL